MNRLLMGVSGLCLFTMMTATAGAASLQGTVGWGEPLTLSTNLAAEVVKAEAAVGQVIKRGALLVELEQEVLRARLDQAKAAVAHRELLLAEAENELQRNQELYDRTLLSDHDLDVARIAHAEADSEARRAQAELVVAQRRLEEARIVAPFDAVVMQRHVRVGMSVNGRYKPAPLYTLVPSRERMVRLSAGGELLAKARIGGEVAVRAGQGRYRGRIDAIVWQERTSGEAEVHIVVPVADDDVLKPGSEVEVTLP